MVMAGATRHIEELIGGMDRGLLVTRFHYTNPVHRKKVIITGMTRDGTFLVEGGKIVGPVRNLRFTDVLPRRPGGRRGRSAERRCIRGSSAGASCRRCALSSFSFTGATAAG